MNINDIHQLSDHTLTCKIKGYVAEIDALTEDFAEDRANPNLDQESKEILNMVDSKIERLKKTKNQLLQEKQSRKVIK